MKKQKSTSREPKASKPQPELIILGRPEFRRNVPTEFRISTSLVNKILSAANTPNQHRSAIRTRVESTIIQWRVNDRVNMEFDRRKKIGAPLIRIVRIARQTEKLLKAVQQLEPELRLRLTASLTMEEEDDFLKRGEFWLPNVGTEVIPYERELHRFAELARRAAAKPKRTVSHRPRFSSRHNSLLSLIGSLYDLIVVEAGGEMTLWHEVELDELKGTLPTVLDILRPILPHTIPDRQKLYYSTLSRLLRQAKNPQKF